MESGLANLPVIIPIIIAVAGLAYFAVYRARNQDLVHLHHGMRLADQGEHEEALAAFTQALEINPDLTEAKLAMVRAYRRLERLDEAIDLCRDVAAAVTDDRDAVEVLELLGRLYSEAGRPGEAVKAYERLIEIWPENVDGRLAMAEAQRSLGQHEEALAVYEELASAHGTDVGLCYRLADLYRRLGRCDEAAKAYEDALAIQMADRHGMTGFAQTLMIMGDMYGEFDRCDSALEAYTKAHESDHDWPAPYRGIGDVLTKLGRYDEAMAAYQQAIEIDETWEDAWCGVAALHAKLQRMDEALAAYRRAIDINPQFAAAHLDMGLLLADAGRAEQAMQSLETALQLDPRGEVGKEARRAIDELSTPRMPPDA